MTYSVGLLIYDGFDLQELATPYHVLAHAAPPHFTLHTVARTKELVTCFGGAKFLPDHIYPDAEIYDVLLIPGGPGYQDALRVLRLMDWINRASKLAQVVSAVNTGIYLLAASRLLSGQTVAAVPGLPDAYPEVHIVENETVVKSGKYFTISSHLAGSALAQAIIQELEGSATPAAS